eukprot:CAMPEP_0168461436 /NCGR_PEP_ID=MMETSP0228-20121227/53983_1 /TAXON_ID=133427 /ORGANISM="Protoceratium reticulatum, Strain CCCM 535 (=CCMP 1889)" /LENGTH=239 /DNA_ID=CAMNT_0008476749 /DNA_START=168 /DNA_END=884 /DNA_ORIENTATION=+
MTTSRGVQVSIGLEQPRGTAREHLQQGLVGLGESGQEALFLVAVGEQILVQKLRPQVLDCHLQLLERDRLLHEVPHAAEAHARYRIQDVVHRARQGRPLVCLSQHLGARGLLLPVCAQLFQNPEERGSKSPPEQRVPGVRDVFEGALAGGLIHYGPRAQHDADAADQDTLELQCEGGQHAVLAHRVLREHEVQHLAVDLLQELDLLRGDVHVPSANFCPAAADRGPEVAHRHVVRLGPV